VTAPGRDRRASGCTCRGSSCLGPDRGGGGCEQGGLEEQVALARCGSLRLARALIVARGDPSPGRQAPGGGEHAHIGADLGDDGGCCHPIHAGNLHQQPVLSVERLELELDAGVERLGNLGYDVMLVPKAA
jgi:hypothetical protein